MASQRPGNVASSLKRRGDVQCSVSERSSVKG